MTAYEAVMGDYISFFDSTDPNAPEPVDPIGTSAFAQYRASMRKIFGSQVDNKSNALPWDHIWTPRCTKLQKLVQERRKAVSKSTYAEKQESEFAPYAAVERYADIENEFWKGGESNMRQCAAYHKYRYNFLHTTSGILRFESLYRAELSDFLILKLKKPEDPHDMLLMITQIGFGK